jgi:hypothetical protein
VAPGESCYCNICRRQPPFLKALASHVVFNFVFNFDLFELTWDLTFDQYVYAVNTYQVDAGIIRSSGCPSIQIEFRFDCCPFHKLHLHCPEGGCCILRCSTNSLRLRMRSRLSRLCNTDSGVAIESSCSSFQSDEWSMRSTGIYFPKTYPRNKIRNSKFIPQSKFKIHGNVCHSPPETIFQIEN